MHKTAMRLLVALLASAPSAAAGQAPASQPQPATPPDAAAVDAVLVVTASRREELLLNAPATMTVIDEEAIGTAPVQSVTDLLKPVPGLNTVRTSARDVNVTTRAATGTLSDSMLVLLDGRSVYQDFFGFVLWDFLPVDTDGDQADRGDSRPGIRCLGRQCHDRRGQRDHEDAEGDAGHERVDSVRSVRPVTYRRALRGRGTVFGERDACGGARAIGSPTRCRRVC